MKIRIHDLSEIDTELDFTQNDKWLLDAVTRCDERDEIVFPPPHLTQQARPIETHLSLRMIDQVIVISGKVKTNISLICSRCTLKFQFPCASKFSTLYCRDAAMAGIAHLARDPENRDAPLKPQGQNRGFARHAHDESLDSEEGFGKDLDITYISEDFINLADLVTEQLTLQLPFQPLCKEECKGICSQCGADQNVGRCGCAKLTKETPFSVLRKFKI